MYQSCNFYHFLGPAYSIQTVNKENYVKAVGSFHDLIAIYEFKVAFTASYVVWKQTFATTNNTNDVSFRIDEGDWYLWRPPQKSSHALWTQYYFQVQGPYFYYRVWVKLVQLWEHFVISFTAAWVQIVDSCTVKHQNFVFWVCCYSAFSWALWFSSTNTKLNISGWFWGVFVAFVPVNN